jgi:NADPH-dependent curcumin reductase CurA
VSEAKNRRVVLRSRPPGLPTLDNFDLVEEAIPEPAPGEVLLRTRWLSIEPYMLLGMKGAAPHSPKRGLARLPSLANLYLGGVQLGATMYGPTISEVVTSRNDRFAEGDVVVAYSGWQRFAVDDGATLLKIDENGLPLTAWLGVLGIPGFTAYVGMKRIAQVQPGDTVVVSAALGPVGSVVGQMARIAGARAIGIASGAEKCRILVEELHFDAAVDRLAPDLAAALAGVCPGGIDVYFENAGGAVWWAVFPLLKEFARVPVCGLASKYSGIERDGGGDRTMEVLERILLFRMKIEGIFVFDHTALESEFRRDVSAWVADGRVKFREDVVDGLDAAPGALINVLNGRNKGKLLVRVTP